MTLLGYSMSTTLCLALWVQEKRNINKMYYYYYCNSTKNIHFEHLFSGERHTLPFKSLGSVLTECNLLGHVLKYVSAIILAQEVHQ